MNMNFSIWRRLKRRALVAHREETIFARGYGHLQQEPHHGHLQEMLARLSYGPQLDSAAYAQLLQNCGDSRALALGKQVHAHIVREGLDGGTFVGNNLMQMYLKCGAIADARQAFHRMKEQSVITWTVTIAAFAQNGHCKEAIRLFKEMQLDGLPVDRVAFVTVLNACGNCEALMDGKGIHDCLTECGFESDVAVASALINMYGKCRSLDEAIGTFNKHIRSNVVSWSAMLGAYANSHSHGVEALRLYRRMQLEGVAPDNITLITCLNACIAADALAEGEVIHGHIVECGLESDGIIANALVNMYGKCGSPEDALRVFSRMHQASVVSWTSVIGAFAQHGHLGNESTLLFQKMQLEGVRPNRITFVTVLSSCDRPVALAEGRRIHACIVETGLQSDVTVGNSLVDMYCKCGSLSEALEVLNTMRKRDAISWNAMISGYVQHGRCMEGLRCLQQMQQDGQLPTKVTYVTMLNACSSEEDLAEGRLLHLSIVNSGLESDEVVKSSLLNMYGKCGKVEDVCRIFERISERGTIAWNIVVAAHVRCGDQRPAFKLFQQMQLEGVKPDAVTFVILLSACSGPALLVEGTTLHARIVQLGLESVIVRNTLIGMYAKCGSLVDARKTFEKMHQRDRVSWNSMISAYVQHGCCADAFWVFRKMKLEGLRPQEATYITILDACTSPAAVAEGRFIHGSITEAGFDKKVGVANALVIMYGKCGSLEDARNIFDTMAQRDRASWNTLIAAYVEHGLCEEALELFWKMDLVPDNVTYIAALDACANLADLSHGKRIHSSIVEHGFESDAVVATNLVNMYGKCGSLDEARKIFDRMPVCDVVTWTSIIVAYAQHNECEQAFKLMYYMQQEGVKVDAVVFVSILSGCDHNGLLKEGCHYFVSMVEDYGIRPRVEHYGCMIDILGRAGHLDVAEKLISKMAARSDVKVWMALLGACRIHNDVERAKRAAKRIIELDPEKTAAYVVLSNMYTNCRQS